MLDTLIVILVLLWAFGYFGGAHIGFPAISDSGLIHILLVVAVVVVIVRLLQGRL